MPSPPDPAALLLASTPPLVAAALRSVASIRRFERTQRLERLDRYYRGAQYDDRAYGWDGRHLASSESLGGFAPFYPDWIVPLDQRRPPANYLVGRVIVDRFTSLLFGDGSFPEIRVEGDPVTEDFLRATSAAAQLPERMTHARNLGGAQGTAVLSYAWVDGLPVVEVHSAAHVLVLRWADPQRHVPHHVLKIWPTSEPAVDAEGQLVEREGWLAREWLGPAQGREGREGRERVYVYTPADRDRPAQWTLAAEAALSECPVVWSRNEPVDERHDGEGDFEGSESTSHELNVILCATSTGTALNADPTLVVKCDPKLNPGRTKKGAYNTIYSPGGAEYLELSGQAVRAGIENVERLRANLFEQTGMTILDAEKMSGRAQSGEALKRLMAPTLAKADRRRETYGAGIVQVLTGLWRLAKRIEAAPAVATPKVDEAGAPVLDAAGAPVVEMRKPALRVPPRRPEPEAGAQVGGAAVELVERRPGAGGTCSSSSRASVTTPNTGAAALIALSGASTGLSPLAARIALIRASRSGTRLFAEASAGGLGVRAPDLPLGVADPAGRHADDDVDAAEAWPLGQYAPLVCASGRVDVLRNRTSHARRDAASLPSDPLRDRALAARAELVHDDADLDHLDGRPVLLPLRTPRSLPGLNEKTARGSIPRLVADVVENACIGGHGEPVADLLRPQGVELESDALELEREKVATDDHRLDARAARDLKVQPVARNGDRSRALDESRPSLRNDLLSQTAELDPEDDVQNGLQEEEEEPKRDAEDEEECPNERELEGHLRRQRRVGFDGIRWRQAPRMRRRVQIDPRARPGAPEAQPRHGILAKRRFVRAGDRDPVPVVVRGTGHPELRHEAVERALRKHALAREHLSDLRYPFRAARYAADLERARLLLLQGVERLDFATALLETIAPLVAVVDPRLQQRRAERAQLVDESVLLLTPVERCDRPGAVARDDDASLLFRRPVEEYLLVLEFEASTLEPFDHALGRLRAVRTAESPGPERCAHAVSLPDRPHTPLAAGGLALRGSRCTRCATLWRQSQRPIMPWLRESNSRWGSPGLGV